VPRAVVISVNAGIDDAERPARRASGRRVGTEVSQRAARRCARRVGSAAAVSPRSRPAARQARRARRLAHDPEQLARSLEVMGLAEMPDYRSAIDDRFRLIAGGEDAKVRRDRAPRCPRRSRSSPAAATTRRSNNPRRCARRSRGAVRR